MPKRLVKDTIVLHRKDETTGAVKQVVPDIGREFDFTAEELVFIAKAQPAAVEKIGEVVVENTVVDPADAGRVSEVRNTAAELAANRDPSLEVEQVTTAAETAKAPRAR